MELFEEATKYHVAGDFVKAEELYDQLLTQNHNHPGLLATMGTMYLQTNRCGLAITMLEMALEKSKKPPSDVLSNLGLAYKYAGLHDKSRSYLERSIKINPSAETLTNYGSLFIESGTPEKGIEVFERALKKDPTLGLAHWNYALSLLESGRWDTAWDEHEWGFKIGQRIDRKLGNKPVWDGTHGKTVAVYGEQGIGDEIMFASMLPEMMKTNKVILECHTRLKSLFENSFPGLTCYGTREDEEVFWPEKEDFDYRISIGSLGKFYRRSRESFPGTPYLKSASIPKSDKFRVGISWTGGQKAGRVQRRTVPLSWWKSILNNDCEFISLQYTDCNDEIALVERLGYTIKQYPEIKAEDYSETAKIVQSCDLVITVCTSVVHLAGALGVPCWVMTPKAPAWRYQSAGGMPWYKSVRLYRQPPKEGTWIPVVERVGFDLSELLNSRKQAVA